MDRRKVEYGDYLLMTCVEEDKGCMPHEVVRNMSVTFMEYFEYILNNEFGEIEEHLLKVHSENLYQIFIYVKNKEVELRNQEHESVSGMLLYVKTDEAIYPDHEYKMSGNCIAVRTLDLNKDFYEIKKTVGRDCSRVSLG